MDKVQIGVRIHEMVADQPSSVISPSFRDRLLTLASSILTEEYNGVVTPKLLGCKDCVLCESRTHVVPGSGPTPADIMFIGEAPGAVEDEQGKPFVGPAGQMLDTILGAAQAKLPNGSRWNRDNIYITNVVKCRPEDNRIPNLTERVACNPFLREEIEKVNPKFIICWGATAASQIIHPGFKITQESGLVFVKNNRKLIALYHPSYILRLQSLKDGTTTDVKRAVWNGIIKVNQMLEENIDN